MRTATEPTPQRTPRLFWEDFPASHVMEFGGMPVSREAVLAFAQQFDHSPFTWTTPPPWRCA